MEKIFERFVLLIIVFFLLSNCSEYTGHLYLARIQSNDRDSFQGYKYGYIDAKGRWRIKPVYWKGSNFDNGIAFVYLKKKHYIITKNGERYPSANLGLLSHMHARDGISKKHIYFYHHVVTNDRARRLIKISSIPQKFLPILFGKKGERLLNVFMRGPNWCATGFADSKGLISIVHYHDSIVPHFEGHHFPFVDGLTPKRISISKKRDSVTGYINKMGQLIIKPRFFSASGFSEGLAVYTDKYTGKNGYINTNGQVVISPKFYWAKGFNEGVAVVGTKCKMWRDANHEFYKYYTFVSHYPAEFRLINRKGAFISSGRYARAERCSEGLIPVLPLKKKRWCYVNKSGKVVLQGDWAAADPFYNGLALVKKSLKSGRMIWLYINKKGKVVWQEK